LFKLLLYICGSLTLKVYKMSDTTNTENQEQQQLTSEQIEAMRKNMVAYYKEQISTLKLQSEYEKLLADIEEARAKRIMNTIRIAQMMAGPREEEEESEEEPVHNPQPEKSNPPRKLKTE